MSLLLAGSLFFGGALAHMTLSYYINVYQSKRFVKETTEQMLTFMSLLSWDFASMLHMKYDALEESKLSEEEKEKVVLIDKKIYEAWKKTIVAKAFPAFPRKHIKLLPTFDWDGALRPLDNIYYNKPESKDKGGQTHEQD
jgi:hypothetical protein|tara:strand:- start:362 stop:781 length:420 start_codon:yes stop_codon:yes gene_type:complete